jgi:hypothetical protein
MKRYNMESDILRLRNAELLTDSIRKELCQTSPEINLLPYEQSKNHARRQAISAAIGAVGGQAIVLSTFSYFISQTAMNTIKYGADAVNIGSLVVFSATAIAGAAITARCASWCIDSTKEYFRYKREQKQYIEEMKDNTIERIVDNSSMQDN